MHVESVDLRSKIRKADAVLPVFARAGQRSDTLKPSRGAAQVSFVVSSRGATLLLQLSISKYKSKSSERPAPGSLRNQVRNRVSKTAIRRPVPDLAACLSIRGVV